MSSSIYVQVIAWAIQRSECNMLRRETSVKVKLSKKDVFSVKFQDFQRSHKEVRSHEIFGFSKKCQKSSAASPRTPKRPFRRPECELACVVCPTQ